MGESEKSGRGDIPVLLRRCRAVFRRPSSRRIAYGLALSAIFGAVNDALFKGIAHGVVQALAEGLSLWLTEKLVE